MVAVEGFFYLIANAAGTVVMGKPVYPIADWKYPLLTFFLYMVLAVLMTALYVAWAKVFARLLPYKPTPTPPPAIR